MERLHFRTKVLGPIARRRLKHREVTQSIKSQNSTIPRAVSGKQLEVGGQIEVYLDDTMLGIAKLTDCKLVRINDLATADAIKGGFDNISQLLKALRRVGYPHPLFQVTFKWLKEQ